MKLLLSLLLVIGLTGCETFVRKEVVVQHDYIVRKATDQQKALPPFPAPINVLTADQLALAQWIADSERRQLDLESIIRRLIEFYEAPPLPAETTPGPPAPASAASSAS
jgi:hypothetical protein